MLIIDLIVILYTEGIQQRCSFQCSMFRLYLRGSATYMSMTALQPIYPRDIILKSLVLVHAGYLFCKWHPLNTNYYTYRITIGGMPRSFDSSQINVCGVRIGVLGPSEGQGLHKMLHLKGFEPSTSRMPGKCRASLPWLPFNGNCCILRHISWHVEKSLCLSLSMLIYDMIVV